MSLAESSIQLRSRVIRLLCKGLLICLTAHGQAANGQTEQDVHAGLRQGVDEFDILDTESRIGIPSYSLYGPIYRRFIEDLQLSDEQKQISDALFVDYYHSLKDADEVLDLQYRESKEGLSELFVRDMYADIELGSPEFEALSKIEQGKVRVRHRMARSPDYSPPLSFAAPGYAEARNAMIVDLSARARKTEHRIRQVFLNYISLMLSDFQHERYSDAVKAIDVNAACFEIPGESGKFQMIEDHLDIRGLLEDASVEGGELSALYPIWPPRPDTDETLLETQLRLDRILIWYQNQYADYMSRRLDFNEFSSVIFGSESKKDRAVKDDMRLNRVRFTLWDTTSHEIESLLNESQGPGSAQRWKERFLDAMYPGIPKDGLPTLMHQWLLKQDLEPGQIAAIDDIHNMYFINRQPLLERSRAARRKVAYTRMNRILGRPHPEYAELESVWESRTALANRTNQSFRRLFESSLQPDFDAHLDEITQLQKSSSFNPN